MAEIITNNQKDALLDARSRANLAIAFMDSLITPELWTRERAILAISYLNESAQILKGLV